MTTATTKAPREKPTAAIVAPGQSPFDAIRAHMAAEKAKPKAAKVTRFQGPLTIGAGITASMDGDLLILAIDVSEGARSEAEPTESGANFVLAQTTSRFQRIEGTDLSLNLWLGATNPGYKKKGKK